MGNEYLLAAKALDAAAANLEQEIRKLRDRAAMYRRRATQSNELKRHQRDALSIFNERVSQGRSRYDAALSIAQEWNAPLDSILQWIFMSEKAVARAKREMRNDHVVRLHALGLANEKIARHSAVIRLNNGEPLHPNSIPRIVRQTRERIMPPTLEYRPILF